MSVIPFTLIIPAAGSGERMGTEIPKPFLSAGGKPVLGHTLSRFTGLPGLQKIIVATSRLSMDLAGQIAVKVAGNAEVCIVEGGESRQESVFRALEKTGEEDGLIVIQDAVRPFTGRREITECLKMAESTGAAILAVPVNDTIKKAGTDRTILGTQAREGLWMAQTPQIFRRDILLEAHTKAKRQGFTGTDDASLVEWLEKPVALVEGSAENFKLTYPYDWRLAEILLEQESTE